ncbi:helix-turn-helix transcriptional regulator [Streptomyces sp. ISL-36]|uniref:helix-turn-helix transcriptional regulator n=1 Tax=Streptomyces sp. ISL-36 TaxID=2819182 RepID=UPI001BE54CBB|nr:helix-turn-helix transcriptional regulator [Streptomyces sp. ISL-36]MBT2444906.1 helix-turn-helix transcriptional regulator [Streptomyces sp. ISL-36]
MTEHRSATAELLRSETVRERRGALRQRIESAEITVRDILCCEDRTTFAGPAHADGYTVVLTRSGGYLRQIAGEEFFVDPTGGYLTRPGDEQRVAHPVGPGDRSTEIHIGERLFADRFDGRPATRRFTVTAATDLHHRTLLAAARHGTEPFELAERPHRLLDGVAASLGHWRADATARPSTARVHGRLVRDTCAALAAGPPALGLSLEELARTVGASPHHLSRVFHAVTGSTLTQYRTELRLRGVLHALEEGEENLRTLSYTYGFADQAHLTRTCRSRTGHVPSAVRTLLADRA